MPIVFSFSVEELPSVEVLSENTIHVVFEEEVVVDSTFRDLSRYDVSVVSGSGDVAVRMVLVPTRARATDQVVLVLDKLTGGTHYRVTVSGLNGRSGSLVGGTSDFVGRRTKGGDMLRSMPSLYNKQPGSIINAILVAVGREDDLIGGGRDDFFR